jgi:hypothetical protein
MDVVGMINTLLKYVFVVCMAVAIGLLFSGHFHLQTRHEKLRQEFESHWHYAPKPMVVAIDEPRRGSNVPYNLTPTKPKPKQTNQTGYIYCSYFYYR